jgi:hypothetical protein
MEEEKRILIERKSGVFKIFVCNVNLDDNSSVPGLHLALFENASATTSPAAKSALRDISIYLTSVESGLSEKTQNIVGVGLDIVSDIASELLHVPVAGILGRVGLDWLKRRLSRRRGRKKTG